MPTYKLTLEYDGTRYRGWQTQTNTERTVAAALERAASDLLGEPTRVHGAGRTDAGVHALGQVAHFRTKKTLAGDEIVHGLNDRLPHDVNILDAVPVPESFHARHDAASRTYLYRISKRRNALQKRFVWWVKDELDVEAMICAARLFEGRKDFSSFCENPGGQQSTIVHVESCRVEDAGEEILIRVTASHFLWKMIRRLVGTLVEVGRGKLREADVARMLASPTREAARWTAPPSGLFLEEVRYAPLRRP